MSIIEPVMYYGVKTIHCGNACYIKVGEAWYNKRDINKAYESMNAYNDHSCACRLEVKEDIKQ